MRDPKQDPRVGDVFLFPRADAPGEAHVGRVVFVDDGEPVFVFASIGDAGPRWRLTDWRTGGVPCVVCPDADASRADPACPACGLPLRVDWRGTTAAVLCTPECGYSDRLTLQTPEGREADRMLRESFGRRPTIREHIAAVKAAYEEGYDLGVSLGAAEPRYWGTSEARGLLAQCWFDEVEAVDRQDAAPPVRTHWLRRGVAEDLGRVAAGHEARRPVIRV